MGGLKESEGLITFFLGKRGHFREEELSRAFKLSKRGVRQNERET